MKNWDKQAIQREINGQCPFCGADGCDYSNTDVENGNAIQDGRCLDCKREWRAIYHLAEILPIERSKRRAK